ncbi:uncharacterized protein LOC121431709 isoform X2 [Lytechinus variegatus]|uniref:uncharacterized protein LOC121431709 isoform X2 n=1 Tax=Lytechinus variegatus TaxID=7654 RepID=UPI001BB1FF17|nr:uncharacterized protein LOC121431709 isoform X2 [Lytechinus variegatus]
MAPLYFHSVGVTCAIFIALTMYAVSVNGIPLLSDGALTDEINVQNRITTAIDSVLSLISRVGNHPPFPSNGSFNRHMACRGCKQIIADVRFALLIEQGSTLDTHDCTLLIGTYIGDIFQIVYQSLDQIRICQNFLHLCPANGEDNFDTTENEIPVEGFPVGEDRKSTLFDDTISRIFNETRNEVGLFNGIIDWQVACRACKQFIIDARFAMIIEKTSISTFFTDKCNDVFSDKTDIHDCNLVIEQKVDKIYSDILDRLNAQKICRDTIHLCPAMDGDDDIVNDIPNDIME